MKAVLRLTGLTADTLRAWERRYGAVTPKRSGSGRRVYSEREVNRLKLLAELVRQGHLIGSIAELPDRELVGMLASSREAGSASIARGGRNAEEVLALIDSVRRYDLGALKVLLARARHVLSPRDFAFDLVPQLMVEVGIKIDCGELSVAQEHALSDLVRHQLREIFEDLEAVDGTLKPARAMLFGAPEGQHHDFGVLMAATLCRFRGVRAHFLGPNLPADALAQAARDTKAAAVVLGIAALPPEEEKVPPQQYVETLDRLLPRSVPLWLGGSGVSRVRRERFERELYVFESLGALEVKLDGSIRRAS